MGFQCCPTVCMLGKYIESTCSLCQKDMEESLCLTVSKDEPLTEAISSHRNPPLAYLGLVAWQVWRSVISRPRGRVLQREGGHDAARG